MSSADTRALIERAIVNFQAEVPALAQLKLVIELELPGHRDVQLYRVEVPGPRISKENSGDARVRLSVQRAAFNELAAEGRVRQWRDAFAAGTAKASGPPEILKLIQNVVLKQEERSQLRKAKQR
jgi:hypothetical protein